MAHFYGYFQGKGKQVTRTGTRNSGIHARIQGYRIGVDASVTYDPVQDSDIVTITLYGGRKEPDGIKTLRFKRDKGELIWVK